MKDFVKKIWEMKYTRRTLISVTVGSAFAFLLFYIFLPPINLRSVGFWVYLAVIALVYSIPFLNIKFNSFVEIKKSANGKIIKKARGGEINKWALLPTASVVAVLLIGLIISSTLFNARRYAAIIEVQRYDFSEDMKESEEITHIALMDTESAMMLGNRTLGELSNTSAISQYTVSEAYTQINYKNTPKKVSNLEYDGFFKWIANSKNGIPGYVMVDPVKSSSEFVSLTAPMTYAESAYFHEDLERKLRFDYPTKIFESISFEVDDENNPYYIVSCSTPTVGLFGASDISEVIIFDPTSGESELVDVSSVPQWIDIVYTGDLATEKYNWYGTLSGGFINSVIGNVDCTQSTDDFGYIALEDDVWYFTGVTSAVSDDLSNIGFILTNARTGEYKFYPVIGAEEHSAMAAAEGEVQEKGYVASFPSLVNIAGEATYIMVLKDASGLVKLYALVNVENYSIVATGENQTEAMKEYKRLLRANGIESDGAEDTALTRDIEVHNLRDVTISGNSYVYIRVGNELYRGSVADDETLLFITVGSKITVTYTKSDTEGIYIITSWEPKE
ncbi:MAG: hypothetical protein IJ488_04185 [Clostridia bacterium]|nr:hypothetical protein [Clostridia bacterium]